MDLACPSHTTYDSNRKSPLILGVDYNEDNLLLLAHIMGCMGCDLITARNGNDVFSFVRDYQPDLILLDIILPGLSGIQVIEQLKRNKTTKHIPIIAVTGFANPQKCNYLLQIGCQDCIIKPYLIEEVESLVFNFIKKHPSLMTVESLVN